MTPEMASDRVFHGACSVPVQDVAARLSPSKERVDEGIEIHERGLDPLAAQVESDIFGSHGSMLWMTRARDGRRKRGLFRLFLCGLRAFGFLEIASRYRKPHTS